MFSDLSDTVPNVTRFTMQQQDTNKAIQQKRKTLLQSIFESLKMENTTTRIACSTCGTLVKPDCMEQHHDAFHPKEAHVFLPGFKFCSSLGVVHG